MRNTKKKILIVIILLVCILSGGIVFYLKSQNKVILNDSKYLLYLKSNDKNSCILAYDLKSAKIIKISEIPYLNADIVCDQKNIYITTPKTYINNRALKSKIYSYNSSTGKITDTLIRFDCIASLHFHDKLVTYGVENGNLYIAIKNINEIKYIKIIDNFKPFSATILNDDIFFLGSKSIIKYSLKTNKIEKNFSLGQNYKRGLIVSKDNDILAAVSNEKTEILLLTNDLDSIHNYHIPNLLADIICGKEEILINSNDPIKNTSTIYILKDNNISEFKYNKTLSINNRGVYDSEKQCFLLPHGNEVLIINENNSDINKINLEEGINSELVLKN